MRMDAVIFHYYRYLKMKCYHFGKDQCSISLTHKPDKKHYFSQLDNQQLLQELNLLSELYEYAFKTTDTYLETHLQFKLLHYLHLLFLQDLLKLHSSTILCTSAILHKINTFTLEELLIFKSLLLPFNAYSDKLIDFINSHQALPGFDNIELDDIYLISDVLVESLDSFIDIKNQF